MRDPSPSARLGMTTGQRPDSEISGESMHSHVFSGRWTFSLYAQWRWTPLSLRGKATGMSTCHTGKCLSSDHGVVSASPAHKIIGATSVDFGARHRVAG